MINVKGVSKEFRLGSLFSSKVVCALSNVTFSIETGESVAFLGPNGAGKSTLIRILAGILKPTIGSSTIDGFPSGSRLANQRLGLIMGTRSQLWMHMTVRENLNILAEVYDLNKIEKKKNFKEVSDSLELNELLDRRVRTLSLGQRMRCEMAASLIHFPSILLLDEPTIGLDFMAKLMFRDLLQTWCRERKITILLTSHDISDIEAIGKRVILINRGQLTFDGTTENLKQSTSQIRNIKILTENAPYEQFYQYDPARETIGEVVQKIIGAHGNKLLDLQISERPLEEVLREHLSGVQE